MKGSLDELLWDTSVKFGLCCRNGTLGNLNFGSKSVLYHDSRTSNQVDWSEAGCLAVCFWDQIEIILQPRMMPLVFFSCIAILSFGVNVLKTNIF
jgi:hypothetical protein